MDVSFLYFLIKKAKKVNVANNNKIISVTIFLTIKNRENCEFNIIKKKVKKGIFIFDILIVEIILLIN